MELIKQKDQANLLVADKNYESSKLCTKCRQPTRLGVMKCMNCLQEAFLAEELVYTQRWLLEHPGEELVVGHDKHKLLHLALLRAALQDVGWCGTRVSQKRDKRKRLARHDFPAAALRDAVVCTPCLEAWTRMGLT